MYKYFHIFITWTNIFIKYKNFLQRDTHFHNSKFKTFYKGKPSTKFKWTNLGLTTKSQSHHEYKNTILTTKNITMAIKKMITNTWWIFFCLANQSFSSSFSFTSLGVPEWGCQNADITASSLYAFKSPFFGGPENNNPPMDLSKSYDRVSCQP